MNNMQQKRIRRRMGDMQDYFDNTPEPEDPEVDWIDNRAAEIESACFDDRFEFAAYITDALMEENCAHKPNVLVLIERLHSIYKHDYAASEGLAEALRPYLKHRAEQKLEELKNEQ